MTKYSKILSAVRGALSCPVYPFPARGSLPCAVYRFQPKSSDGSLAVSHLTIRVFARSVPAAEEMIDRIRHALITDGDTGVIGEGDGALILCGTNDGGGFGFVRGTGFYYMQAGFDVKGRA